MADFVVSPCWDRIITEGKIQAAMLDMEERSRAEQDAVQHLLTEGKIAAAIADHNESILPPIGGGRAEGERAVRGVMNPTPFLDPPKKK